MRRVLLRREAPTLLALVVVVLVFAVLDSMYLSPDNLIDIVEQATINGLLALGITFVIITGGIDLSVGSTMAIVIVVVGQLTTEGGLLPFPAVLAGVGLGLVMGAVNGGLVTRFGLQPFIATLATMSVFRGIAYIVTGGWPVLNVPESFRRFMDGDIFGVVPIAIVILLVAALLAHLVLTKTRTGVYIFAIGGNAEATRLSGVNVSKNKMIAYMLCGVGAALAGMVLLARLGTGEPTAGQGHELNAIAAAALGGTSLAGGKGSIVGTLLGAVLLSALRVGLVVQGVDAFWQFIATGAIIAFAAYFEIVRDRLNVRR
ncbi:MAG TPA: ABC transporter permease [Coriobacteriia bacterium]|nr:ABC transporter permease [Coriobacteriia bacterium]